MRILFGILMTLSGLNSSAFAASAEYSLPNIQVIQHGETFQVGDLTYKWIKPDNRAYWRLTVARNGTVIHTINLGSLMRGTYDLCAYGIFDNPEAPLFVCGNIKSSISGSFAFYDMRTGGFDIVSLDGSPGWPSGVYKNRVVFDVVTDNWDRPHKQTAYTIDLKAAKVVSTKPHAEDEPIGGLFAVKGADGYFRQLRVNGKFEMQRLDENLNVVQRKSLGDTFMLRLIPDGDEWNMTMQSVRARGNEGFGNGDFNFNSFDFNWYVDGQLKVRNLGTPGQPYALSIQYAPQSGSFPLQYRVAKIGANFTDQMWLAPLGIHTEDLGFGSGSDRYKTALKFSELNVSPDQKELSFSVEWKYGRDFCHADFRIDNQTGQVLSRKVIGEKACLDN